VAPSRFTSTTVVLWGPCGVVCPTQTTLQGPHFIKNACNPPKTFKIRKNFAVILSISLFLMKCTKEIEEKGRKSRKNGKKNKVFLWTFIRDQN